MEEPLDSGGNPDHVTSGLVRVRIGLGLWLTFHVIPDMTVSRLDEDTVKPCNTGYVLPGVLTVFKGL